MNVLKLQFAPVINVGSKKTQLGLFNFRSFLNIGMLLTESETAKQLRSKILAIVITTIFVNEKIDLVYLEVIKILPTFAPNKSIKRI